MTGGPENSAYTPEGPEAVQLKWRGGSRKTSWNANFFIQLRCKVLRTIIILLTMCLADGEMKPSVFIPKSVKLHRERQVGTLRLACWIYTELQKGPSDSPFSGADSCVALKLEVPTTSWCVFVLDHPCAIRTGFGSCRFLEPGCPEWNGVQI